jgi:phage tail tape-measure protein
MVPEWQMRVIDEASELEARLAKLNDYLGKPVEVLAFSPAAEHRRLLVRQAAEMTAYATTLRERMGLFGELA